MYIAFCIAIVSCLLEINWALLHECSSDTNPYKICIADGKNYEISPPSELNSFLSLDEIVSINEDDNSVTIQAALINYWKMDSNLTLSKNTKM